VTRKWCGAYGSVCCSVLQCVAVCCSVVQCVLHCELTKLTLQIDFMNWRYNDATRKWCGAHSSVCCSVLQCVAVCCSVLQCVLQCKLTKLTLLIDFTTLRRFGSELTDLLVVSQISSLGSPPLVRDGSSAVTKSSKVSPPMNLPHKMTKELTF